MIEKMNKAIASREYGIAIMADLEGAFDSVWREGAIYKLHQAGINSHLLLVLCSFLIDRQYQNLVNTHISDWETTITGVPQGSLLSVLLFLVYTADMTTKEDTDQSPQSDESK